jgi:hypothetical protein
MNNRQRVAGGLSSALCLWVLLGAMIIPAQAGDALVQLINGKNFPSGSVQPGMPQTARPLYSPPVFMDRSTPISERPLAPIGDGAQVAPGSGPFVWCQGQWVRVDNPRHNCPSR